MKHMSALGITKTVAAYNTLIAGMLARGNLAAAVDASREMEREGLRPTTATYTLLIKGFSQRRKLPLALQVFDNLRASGLQPDAQLVNVVIGACAAAGETEKAQRIAWDMIKQGLRPTIHTFISLAKSYLSAPAATPAGKKNLVRGCLSLLDHMREENVTPTLTFYNCVLAVMVRHGRPTDALRIYNLMGASGVSPDIVTFTTLMYNCAEHLLLAQVRTEAQLN